MRPFVFASVCLLGCAGVQLPREQLGDDPGGLLFNGYVKTRIQCFKCHNGDAKGSMIGPGLADPLGDKLDLQLTEAINEGENRMPAYKELLSAEEIVQLLAWLHTVFPLPPSLPTTAKPATP